MVIQHAEAAVFIYNLIPWCPVLCHCLQFVDFPSAFWLFLFRKWNVKWIYFSKVILIKFLFPILPRNDEHWLLQFRLFSHLRELHMLGGGNSISRIYFLEKCSSSLRLVILLSNICIICCGRSLNNNLRQKA